MSRDAICAETPSQPRVRHAATFPDTTLNDVRLPREDIRRDLPDDRHIRAIHSEQEPAVSSSHLHGSGSQHQENDAPSQQPGTSRHSASSRASKRGQKVIDGASARAEKLWLWELLACFLSIACLAAIVGVLIYEDNQPLDEWSLFIGPNAVVSFIGTLAKSSFLVALTEVISQYKWLHFLSKPQKLHDLQCFDEASRGPWGSFKLIIFKHKNALVASLASLVLLVSLLVDPFVQLVFSFPIQFVNDPTQFPTFQTSTVWNPSKYNVRRLRKLINADCIYSL